MVVVCQFILNSDSKVLRHQVWCLLAVSFFSPDATFLHPVESSMQVSGSYCRYLAAISGLTDLDVIAVSIWCHYIHMLVPGSSLSSSPFNNVLYVAFVSDIGQKMCSSMPEGNHSSFIVVRHYFSLFPIWRYWFCSSAVAYTYFFCQELYFWRAPRFTRCLCVNVNFLVGRRFS